MGIWNAVNIIVYFIIGLMAWRALVSLSFSSIWFVWKVLLSLAFIFTAITFWSMSLNELSYWFLNVKNC